MIKKYVSTLLVACAGVFSLVSCYEEPNHDFSFEQDEMTLKQLIDSRADLSAFNAIITKCGYDKRISTYQAYTCFAPVNSGVEGYIDSLYYDENIRFPHNGIQESSNWNSLALMQKIELMSDSLCEDLAKYHLSGRIFYESSVTGSGSVSTLHIGRDLAVNVMQGGPYDGLTSLNKTSAIIEGDLECSNGLLQICSSIIPRSDRTVDDQMAQEDEFSIFHAALQLTGFDVVLQQEKKVDAAGNTIIYDYAKTTPDDGEAHGKNPIYCPTECMVKWTVFAETDEVFKKHGINGLPDLIREAKNWYANSSKAKGGWYDYPAEKGIEVSLGDDYKNPMNAVNMFVAYHILPAGMSVDKLVYEQGDYSGANWNFCFGYEPQEYYETLLPNTLLKIWQIKPKGAKTTYINRYRKNNTLTDQIGTFGSDAQHPIEFEGVQIDRNGSVSALNGYIHRINNILLYDETAVKSQKERMRHDSHCFLYEIINNGIRFATSAEVSTMNAGGNGDRVAFDNSYFDNIVCYNPNTLLRANVTGAWRAHNADQFQGWDVYDFAIRLPHVPTGTYEIRIVYPPMQRGGLMQFYLGTSSDPAKMQNAGIPFNAYENPTLEGSLNYCPSIKTAEEDEATDYGVESDRELKAKGFMRAPASYSRGSNNSITDMLQYDESDIYSAAKSIVGGTSCRSEYGYGTMMLRKIVDTRYIKQSEDLWLRIKNLVTTDPNLGWSFDFIELVPVDIVNNKQMTEDWY